MRVYCQRVKPTIWTDARKFGLGVGPSSLASMDFVMPGVRGILIFSELNDQELSSQSLSLLSVRPVIVHHFYPVLVQCRSARWRRQLIGCSWTTMNWLVMIINNHVVSGTRCTMILVQTHCLCIFVALHIRNFDKYLFLNQPRSQGFSTLFPSLKVPQYQSVT